MKLGLCLSGGGVKGAAHIGVIKALEDENIKPDCISGTSSGSIVAALYAMGYSSEEMIYLFKSYGKQISKINFWIIVKIILGLIFTGKIHVDGLNNGYKIEKLIQNQARNKKINLIRDIKLPLIIPSVDIIDGSTIIFSSLKNNRDYSDKINVINDIEIGKAVQASCSYPGIFCPTNVSGKKLIDGGVRENTPWKELKKIGAEKILSVVFSEERKIENNINIIKCVTRSMGIMMHELYNYEVEGNEYLLKIKTDNTGLLEINKIEELYEIGYKVTKKEINKIKEYLRK